MLVTGNTEAVLACPTCNKAVPPGRTRACLSCKQLLAVCSLCHTKCDGLWWWCAGCGHGMCLDCADGWFEEEKVCPSGCGHVCCAEGCWGVVKAPAG